jgi:hypothetical protein
MMCGCWAAGGGEQIEGKVGRTCGAGGLEQRTGQGPANQDRLPRPNRKPLSILCSFATKASLDSNHQVATAKVLDLKYLAFYFDYYSLQIPHV